MGEMGGLMEGSTEDELFFFFLAISIRVNLSWTKKRKRNTWI